MAELTFTGLFSQQENQDWTALTNKKQQEREEERQRAVNSAKLDFRRKKLKEAYPDAGAADQALEWDSEINEPEAEQRQQRRRKQKALTGDVYKDVFAPAWKLASESIRNVNDGWIVQDWTKVLFRWSEMLQQLEPDSPEQAFVNELERITIDYVNTRQQLLQAVEPAISGQPVKEKEQAPPEAAEEAPPAAEEEEEQIAFLLS